MAKCTVCRTGDFADTTENTINICLDCIEKGYITCDMLERCVNKGYFNLIDKNRYHMNVVLPSVFFQDLELKIIDELLINEIATLNTKNYCCKECYKQAVVDKVSGWYSPIEQIMGLDKMIKIPNQKPFFDDERKYLNYIKSIEF